jgi:hypothetical protein
MKAVTLGGIDPSCNQTAVMCMGFLMYEEGQKATLLLDR